MRLLELMDLVTHNDIVIQAPAASIWPHIVDPNAWKSGVQLIPAGGATVGTGRRFNAVMPGDPHNVLFRAEDIEWVVERRRTIRLNEKDGALIGFASWRLTSENCGTLLEYDVYCQLPSPGDQSGMGLSDPSTTRADFHQTNYRRFAHELGALKRLVEGAHERIQ